MDEQGNYVDPHRCFALIFRDSGTDPLLRICCELDDPDEVHRVLDYAERFAWGEMALL